jgi:hypothetical protein
MNSHKDEVVSMLLGMGFDASEVERAWHASDIKTVEGLINWMDLHPANEQTQNQNPQSGDQKPVQPFEQNIAHLVKKEIVDQLIGQGHTKIVAEKAVLFSGNKDVEAATAWITDHQNDPDFNDPVQVEQKPQLTPEEARAKARELQRMIREKTLREEQEAEIEREKTRIAMNKGLTEAKRQMDEAQQKIALETYLREKNQAERDKQEMLRLLEEDKRRKLGDKYKEKEKQAQNKTTKQGFEEIYDKMYKVYRMGQLDTLRTCLNTLNTVVGNVLKNPSEEKFQKINASNPNFSAKVKDVIGGLNLLNFIGFYEQDGFFVLKEANVQFLGEIKELIEASLVKLANL